MRAIDADVLIDKYGDWYTEEGTEEGYIGTIKGIVDSMPTIEPERKKGKWPETEEDEYWRMWYVQNAEKHLYAEISVPTAERR